MKKHTRILSFILAIAMMATLIFADAVTIKTNAAAARKVTSKIEFSYKMSAAKLKKVPAVKTGTTRVTLAKQHCLVKFTASKNKTYTFTVSNVTDPADKSGIACGHFYVRGFNQYGSLDTLTCKTQGGSASTLRIATPKFLKNWKQTGKKSDWYLKTRSAKVSLKKVETVCIDFFLTVDKKKSLYTLNVK